MTQYCTEQHSTARRSDKTQHTYLTNTCIAMVNPCLTMCTWTRPWHDTFCTPWHHGTIKDV